MNFRTLVVRRILPVVLTVVALVAASQTYRGWMRARAIRAVLGAVVPVVMETQEDRDLGVRINLLSSRLGAGSRVEPFSPRGEHTESLVCRGTCRLFFVDRSPAAHFAHRTMIVLYDEESGSIQSLDTEWWPMVDGEPVFHHLELRLDPETIVFYEPGLPGRPPAAAEVAETQWAATPAPSATPPPSPTPTTCDLWAVVVCGYDGKAEDFREDTRRIHRMLHGLGVPENQITFLSPYASDLGVDGNATPSTVKSALATVASDMNPGDRLFFFYSSHGSSDTLLCNNFSPGGGSITATDLANWLDAVPSATQQIVLNACRSGSFVGRSKGGLYQSANDDLTTSSQPPRVVFTSAAADTDSFIDIDTAGDPNPGDVGSETAGGFIEALATSDADSDADGMVSFAEAAGYAETNDVTSILGWNIPQLSMTGLESPGIPMSCDLLGGSRDAAVGIHLAGAAAAAPSVPAGSTQQLQITITGGPGLAVNTGVVRGYASDGSPSPSWPSAFRQIGDTILYAGGAPSSSQVYTVDWTVPASISSGTQVQLIATFDSPQDPLVGPPALVGGVPPASNNVASMYVLVTPKSCCLLPSGCSSH